MLFQPYFLIEVDNFVPANPLITPTHIVPEWYFLFAYAILRAFSSKLGGVVSLFCSLLILGLLPFTHSQLMKGLTYYGPVKAFFWAHTSNVCLLTVCGSFPSLPPFVGLSFVLTLFYFIFYFVLGRLCYFWDLALS